MKEKILRLPEPLHQKVLAKAKEMGLTVNALLVLIINTSEWLKEEEK